MDDLTHVLSVIDLNNKRYDDRFIAQEKAIQVAEVNNLKWRENANEWRAAMDDREIKFATQIELDVQMHSLNERISKLELYRADTEGKHTGLTSGWSILIAGVGFILTAATLFNLFKGFVS